MNLKETLNKLWCFAQVCAYIVGVIGGVLVALTGRFYFIGACAAAVAAMAWPYVSGKLRDLWR